MFVHRYGMAGAANPPKTSAGKGNTHGSMAPGGKGERPWDMEHLGTSLGGHRAARSPWNVLDTSMSGWHPSICIWGLIPVQTRRGSQENTILETSFDSHDSQQILLPSPPAAAFRELLPASGTVYCWITQSPTSDSRHYRRVFTRFIERISLKKGNLVAWGLVGCDDLDPGVRQRSLEIQSGSKKIEISKSKKKKILKKISQQEIG